jgi:hypothetical protein
VAFDSESATKIKDEPASRQITDRQGTWLSGPTLTRSVLNQYLFHQCGSAIAIAVLDRTIGDERCFAAKHSMPKTYERGSVIKISIVTIFSLLILAPSAVFGDVHLGYVAFVSAVNAREVQDEQDPNDPGDCVALGELDIAFHTNNSGPPTIGIVLTDPRGRRIGFDPLTKRGWQELPVAQGSIDCDESDGKDACRGLVEVCGALSGTYKLEIIANAASDYTLTISARSQEVRDRQRLWSSYSDCDLISIPIRKSSRNFISVTYSRDPNFRIAAQLQKLRDERYEARFHPNPCRSGNQRQRSCLAVHTGGD